MRIAPVNFNYKPSFNGILKEAYTTCGFPNSLGESEDIIGFKLYPFLDDTQEKIKEQAKNYSISEGEGCYITYETQVMPALNITYNQYEALKKNGLDDDKILDIFVKENE